MLEIEIIFLNIKGTEIKMSSKTFLKAVVFVLIIVGFFMIFRGLSSDIPVSENWQDIIAVFLMAIFIKRFFNSKLYKWLQT